MEAERGQADSFLCRERVGQCFMNWKYYLYLLLKLRGVRVEAFGVRLKQV